MDNYNIHEQSIIDYIQKKGYTYVKILKQQNIKKIHDLFFVGKESDIEEIENDSELAFYHAVYFELYKQCEKAIKMYDIAVGLENLNAINNLAFIYEDGTIIAQDYKKSIELCELGMKMGDSHSIKQLAYMYEWGCN